MGLRCEPGDIAVIEHSDFPKNVGLLVEVLFAQFVPPGRNPEWVVRLAVRDVQVTIGTPFGDLTTNGNVEHYIEDWRLKPIRGQQRPDSIVTTAPELARV